MTSQLGDCQQWMGIIDVHYCGAVGFSHSLTVGTSLIRRTPLFCITTCSFRKYSTVMGEADGGNKRIELKNNSFWNRKISTTVDYV